jgi:nucleoid-associated protein YgaU
MRGDTMNRRDVRILPALALVLLTAACARRVGWLDRRDRSEPMMQRAEAKLKEGNTDEAVRLYTDALDRSPKSARGHLDLALILHDHRKDYVGAIYHYRRYLELRPDTEKREMIESRIRLAGQLFAAGVMQADPLAEKVQTLETENRDLRMAIKRWTRERAETPPADASAASGPRSYTVQGGDTLSSIAAQMYGDPGKWQKILDANRQQLGSSQHLKVGQKLVIP